MLRIVRACCILCTIEHKFSVVCEKPVQRNTEQSASCIPFLPSNVDGPAVRPQHISMHMSA